MLIRYLVGVIVLSTVGDVSVSQTVPPEQGKADTRKLGGYENDFTPGRPPTKVEISAAEKEVAAHPDDFKLVRKLGIGYFYRLFGAHEEEAGPKAHKTLNRALELQKDDGLTLAFLGALSVVAGDSLPELKGKHDALFKKALKQEPNNVGMLSLFIAVYSGQTDKAIEGTERIRKLMGAEFKNWSRHGQQQVLITQGKAYVRAGRLQEARTCFEEGLTVNRAMFQAELDKLSK